MDMAQDASRRDQIVLATKVYQPMETGPNDKYLSAFHIRRACEASLKRLKTDHIDLYQMHHIDWATPWDEIWQAMEQLIREGKITYVGSSNFAGWDIAAARMSANARHMLGLASEQSLYNPDRTDHRAEGDSRARTSPPRWRTIRLPATCSRCCRWI